jgi:hypothetical protein
MNTNHKWNIDDLQELHEVLYAFLSFIDEPVLVRMGKDKIGIGHVAALKNRLDDMLQEHGGRSYLLLKGDK